MSQEMNEQVASCIEKIRPMLQADGGDIELIEVTDNNDVKVRLQGACRGCPGARMTLKMGVERRLKAEVPGVGDVIAVD